MPRITTRAGPARWPCRGSASGRARSLPPRRGRAGRFVRASVLVALGAASILSGSVAGVPDAGATTLPTTVEAWIYPGDPGQPTCDVPAELSGLDSDPVAVLKPQYLSVTAGGKVRTDTAAALPCNGFSAADLAAVRAAAHQVYVTVSAGTGATKSLLAGPSKESAALAAIESFVSSNGIDGVDLDFEPNTWTRACGRRTWASSADWRES